MENLSVCVSTNMSHRAVHQTMQKVESIGMSGILYFSATNYVESPSMLGNGIFRINLYREQRNTINEHVNSCNMLSPQYIKPCSYADVSASCYCHFLYRGAGLYWTNLMKYAHKNSCWGGASVRQDIAHAFMLHVLSVRASNFAAAQEGFVT